MRRGVLLCSQRRWRPAVTPPILHHPCRPHRAANERTFLAWLGMATTLGTVGTAIAGFAVEGPDGKKHGAISHGTVELITTLMLPISIAMIAYALFTFYNRSEFIRRKQARGALRGRRATRWLVVVGSGAARGRGG